ncbi:HTH_48 domain-containing protein [Trichonephila inaurata madagascariensis]|uniref:HTH_48 domain-containing protein n=1 Tax=Trichonephila inaurata madagascariensis TaxID=2747483 RepID=A0A8X6YWA7_9ARAC|nr:HTH_48 domain-containing protein [Trichonephila inaurata madagascariensis]
MKTKFSDGKDRGVWDIVTGDETCIYQFEPETNLQSVTWCFPHEPPPTKVRHTQKCRKANGGNFFSYSGHIATVVLEDRRTVTAEWYVTKCLPEMLEQWRQKRPKRGIREMILHHDSASARSAQRMKNYLGAEHIETLPHSPYSPDLSPCDFFLFLKIKNKMRESRFGSAEVLTEYRKQLNQLRKMSGHTPLTTGLP